MVTTSMTSVKLGKLPSRVDPRTLSLSRYLDRGALPAPPAALDLSSHVISWPMYGNDRLGDCTTAAAAHMIEGWTAAAAGDAVVLPESAVLAAFDAVKVVDPETGDEGAVELDVLKLWRSNGIGGHRIGAFARVSRDDRDLVVTGAWLFGGLYIGLQLPLSAADRDVWDWTGSLDGPDAPGSWGGHAVDVVGYDEGGLTIVTWGALKRMTWAFWSRYCDEAWCVLSTDYLAAGRSPQGFDLAALSSDLALVTAGAR
jgi:hypothetical protein